MIWFQGLNAHSSVGGFGKYRENYSPGLGMLPNGFFREEHFYGFSCSDTAQFSISRPDSADITIEKTSWTCRQILCADDRTYWRAYLGSCLPGPVFESLTGKLSIQWSEAVEVDDIDTAGSIMADGKIREFSKDAAMLVCRGVNRSYVLAITGQCSQIVQNTTGLLSIHWQKAGGRVLIAPLPVAEENDSLIENRKIWLAFTRGAPFECEESFRREGDRMIIQQRFHGQQVAPIPPFMSLLSESVHAGDLIAFQQEPVLVASSSFGPLQVVAGDSWEVSIDIRWAETTAVSSREIVDQTLADLPEELVYPGDDTWDLTTSSDQLMAWRVWAPIYNCLPEEKKQALRKRLQLPRAAVWRRDLLQIAEPVLQLPWGRSRYLWAERGDVEYDPDWYNGLELSGLSRAAHCGDPGIEEEARKLAVACRDVREAYIQYYRVFHDWMFGFSWTLPSGFAWHHDCVHNGMDGMIGEARLRELEGDFQGRDECLYLAAKTAVGLMAVNGWIDWLQRVSPELIHHWESGDANFLEETFDAREFFVQSLVGSDKVFPTTPNSRNPYMLSSHFPEYCALFRQHGDVERLRALAEIWKKEKTERYRNWITFYIGENWREAHAAGDHEKRVQAAVFYHLSAEVCARLYILGEDPDEIEALFATPLNLAEQVILRAGFSLHS